jgi:hypothetical protein
MKAWCFWAWWLFFRFFTFCASFYTQPIAFSSPTLPNGACILRFFRLLCLETCTYTNGRQVTLLMLILILRLHKSVNSSMY